MIDNSRYSDVEGFKSPVGWIWKVNGDNLNSLTKVDCEHRIRMLYNGGCIDRLHRNYLLKRLKSMKKEL